MAAFACPLQHPLSEIDGENMLKMLGQERQQRTNAAAQVDDRLVGRVGQFAKCSLQGAAHSGAIGVHEVLLVGPCRLAPGMSLIRHPATTILTSLRGTTITLRTCLPSTRPRMRSSARAAACKPASSLSAGTVILLRSLPLICTGTSISSARV